MENIITNILGMDGKRRYRYFASALLAVFALSPSVLGIAIYFPSLFAKLNPITLLIFVLSLTTPVILFLLLANYEFLKLTRTIHDKNTYATLLSFLFTGFLGLLMLCIAYHRNWTLEFLLIAFLLGLGVIFLIGLLAFFLNLFGVTIPPRK